MILPIWASLNSLFSPNSSKKCEVLCKALWLPQRLRGGSWDHTWAPQELVSWSKSHPCHGHRQRERPPPRTGSSQRKPSSYLSPVELSLDFDSQTPRRYIFLQEVISGKTYWQRLYIHVTKLSVATLIKPNNMQENGTQCWLSMSKVASDMMVVEV